MQKEITTTQLSQWTGLFNKNDGLPFVTKSGLIQLDELEQFVSKIKAQQADSVRIYFLRFPSDDTPTSKIEWPGGIVPEGCKWDEGGSGFTQGSVAIVPTKGFMLDKEYIFSAEDIVVGDQVSVLMPGIVDRGTGLNPPPRAGH